MELQLGKCPFCQSSISGDILMYGGSCPKCFGEIPGEEAATDPGEEVKAKQAKSDNRRVLIRTMIPIALAVPVVGGMLLLAVGFIIWNRDPTVPVMNFDDDEFGIEYDIVSAPPEMVNPDPDAPKTGPKNPRPGNKPGPRPNNDGIADADPTKPPEVVVPKSGNGGGLSFDGIGVNATRSGEVISDEGQIFAMIKKNMTKQQVTLKQCYDKRLKVKEDLQGRWRAKFVVNQKGFATNVSFTGMNMKDAELEACLAKTVAKWRFARIARPQPVEKSWKFRPN